MKKYMDFWNEIWRIVCDFISVPNLKSAFLWGIALYAIALFALLRGDIYYIDDLQHSIIDNSNANTFSRYLTTFTLSGVATFGKGTLDLSPLPQIFGICLVIISSMILIYLIRGKFDFIGIVASLPLGLSPHFLQNLSYKFDSLTMAMALFFAIVPFLFKEKIRIFCAISVVSLILMFMSYQAANATYIILSLYFAFSAFFIKGRSFKESVGFLGICAANLIVASLIYKLTINPIVPLGISDKTIALNSHFFIAVWANLAEYATTIFNDFKQMAYMWLIALNCVLFVINATICTNRPKIVVIFSASLFLALGFALSFGLYVVLEYPLFHPRAFYGFNAFVAIIAIANISLMNQVDSHKIRAILHYFSCTLAIITAYFLISFANIYGNALKKQDEYLDFRAKLLLQDLSDKIPRGAMVDLKIYLDKHPVAQRFAEKYGDISRLIPKVAENDWFFHWRVRHLNAPYNLENSEMCAFLLETFGSEIIAKNAYHTITKSKSCYIVTINK